MIKEIFDLEPHEYGGDGKFHISSNGECWRKLYLQMKGLYKRSIDYKTQRNFDVGNFYHMQVCKELFEKAGTAGLQVVASEIKIPPHKYIAGKADLILSDTKTGEFILVDVKSASDLTIFNVKNGDVSESYINQVQLYLHFLNIKKGYLLFVGKHKHNFEEYEIIYDKHKCLQMISQIENFFIEFVEKNVEPAKCKNRQYGCDACGYK